LATPKLDNSTFRLKAQLRSKALRELDQPVVLETHGGWGKLFDQCYRDVPVGVVFEQNAPKAAYLARQRPTWAVYEADCVRALREGVGSHLEINFLDLDPYGEPWPAIDAFLTSDRPFPVRLIIVVNDGLRQKLRMNGGWMVSSLAEVLRSRGNAALHGEYLSICRELLERKAARQGYSMKRWTGYHCGFKLGITHYAALFEKE